MVSGLHDFGILLPGLGAASPERVASKRSQPISSSFSMALKAVTINVRSLSELGKVKFVARRAADIKADI
eukprot:58590-Amphidinium_carterae.1